MLPKGYVRPQISLSRDLFLHCSCPSLRKKYAQYLLVSFRYDGGLFTGQRPKGSMICLLSTPHLIGSPPALSFAHSTPCSYFWQEHSCLSAFALAVPSALSILPSDIHTVHFTSFLFLMRQP